MGGDRRHIATDAKTTSATCTKFNWQPSLLQILSAVIDPTVVVDTTNSKVVIAGTLIINITGGVAGETNLVKNPITFILKVDDKEQVTRWEAYWDNENAEMLAALGKVSALMKK